LDTFLDLIDDADVLTGWNSEGYDIPYTVNRIAQVLSKNDTRRLCLWDKLPKPREYSKFGDIKNTYDLFGRVHLDYLDLYRKFTYEERQSYSLDSIGEFEVGERKTAYEGTLDQLYKQDFRRFIEYNRQDVLLLVKIDRKHCAFANYTGRSCYHRASNHQRSSCTRYGHSRSRTRRA
jgi:DNA polymerase elongation subunit (family B)